MADDALNRDALNREATGAAPSAHSFTAGQQSDMEAAASLQIAAMADEVLHEETRTLGRDFLALGLLFLIIATTHITNPLLTYEVTFGRAWRNPGLQAVLSVLLIVCALALARQVLASRKPEDRAQGATRALRRGAAVVLAVFCVYAALAGLARWNPAAALAGVPPELMLEEVEDETPPQVADALQSIVGVSTALELAAIAAVVVLWRPWARLAIYRRALRQQTAPIVVGALVIVLWEVLIVVLQIQQFLLPRPSVIAATFLETYPRLISAAWITFQNAFWGFALGCGLGILTGIVAARFTSFSRALLPLAIAINAVPIIALAPIFNNWFGALNAFSKIAICAVLVYFPAMISTVRGLTSVDPLSLELMRSYAASQMQLFRKVRLPNSLPFIFSALKVGTTLATIGAIVSEYFGGSTAGLGFKIRDDAGLFKYPDAWASIVMASLFGILFYLVVSAVERALLHWHVSFREK